MRTLELIGYTRRVIKGRRQEMLLICMPAVTAGLFFLAAETAIYSLLLYFGIMEPAALFTGEFTEQLIIAAVFGILRITVMPPLYCAAAVRARELIDGKNAETPMSRLLLNGRFLHRSISSAIFCKLISAVLLAPSVLSGAYIRMLLSEGADSRQLFMAANLAAAGVFSLILWLGARLSMTAVPFILAEYPEISSLRAVFRSFRVMAGRRHIPAVLFLIYFLPIITIIPAPFFIPEAAAAMTVGMSIFFKEDEEAERGSADIYGRYSNARSASDVSAWQLRSFRGIAQASEKP